MDREAMVEIPAGRFRMGSVHFYAEEAPVRDAEVGRFMIDRGPVTVWQFTRFVQETGYVTVAERPPDPADYPDADPTLLVEGSAVFRPAPGPVPLDDPGRWWAYVRGANWRHPWGPNSDNSERRDHPVTHIAYEDAEAYAAWAGKELPSEAEVGVRGARRTRRGEWTSNYYAPRGAGTDAVASPCCRPPLNPRVQTPAASYDVGRPGGHIPRRVIKGGSHLCAPTYCLRYQPAARQPEAIDTSTSHIGFRCVVRLQ